MDGLATYSAGLHINALPGSCEHERLARIVSVMVQSEPKLNDVEVHVYFDASAPIAHVHVTPGLLVLMISDIRTLALDDAQVEAVVAHEIGHYIASPLNLSAHDEEFAADAYAVRMAGPSATSSLLRALLKPDNGTLRERLRAMIDNRRASATHPSTHSRLARVRTISA